ncbi:MAG: hypothetical protein R3C44_22410 [Chloroflexota bacterium]
MTTESLAPPTRLTRLPITADLRPAVIASLVIAVLAAAGALAGILAPDSVYPTAELLQNSLPNDIVTLVLVIPVLLIALFLAMQGSSLACCYGRRRYSRLSTTHWYMHWGCRRLAHGVEFTVGGYRDLYNTGVIGRH